MQLKTSSIEFERYGSVYETPIVQTQTDLVSRSWHLIAKHSIHQLYRFNCKVYIEMQEGMAALLVGERPQADELEMFALHRLVAIKPGIYFCPVAVTSNITCKLFTAASYSSTVKPLSPPTTIYLWLIYLTSS